MKEINEKEKLLEKVASGVLTQGEMNALLTVEKARWDAMQVDEFNFDSMTKKTFTSVIDEQRTPLD